MTVVEQRSYSRNCASTSLEAETWTSGRRSRRREAIASSWRGSRYENRRQMATDSAPLRSTSATSRSISASSSASTHAVGPDSLRGLDSHLAGRPAAVASARTAGTDEAGPGGRRRAGPRSRAWRSAPSSRRAARAGRWCRRSCRGRSSRSRPARRRRARAPAPPRRARHRTRRRAWSAPSPCAELRPSKTTASVNVPPTSTPSSMPRHYCRER